MFKIQTYLVLRNTLFEEAVVAVLAREHSLRVIPTSGHAISLPRDGIPGRHPVVLYDVDLSRPRVEDYVVQLQRCNATARLMFTGDDEHEDRLLYFLSLGARGWVPRSQVRHTLLLAIKHVNEGGIWVPHRVLVKFVEHVLAHVRYVHQLFDVNPALSSRERQVLVLVSGGATNKDIANELHIAERTAKFHVANLFVKLKVTTRWELMACCAPRPIQPVGPNDGNQFWKRPSQDEELIHRQANAGDSMSTR
jgi:DNA-binding NarL/FixJ family response regulator